MSMNNAQYFYRNAVFSNMNSQVSLVDINNPDIKTPLEEWLGIVVSLADGQHTIQELIDYMGQQYPQPPANLAETLHSVIERLEEGKIIQLSDKAVSLPYYLQFPIERLDLAEAREQIAKDGYTHQPGELH